MKVDRANLFSRGARRIALLASNLRWFLAARRAEREDAWDMRMGTDTAGFVTARNLGIDRDARRHAHEYFGTLPRTFDAMLRAVPVDPSQFVFIDIGAGKGRTLLMAARLGFRRVIGVEISPALCETARANARRVRLPDEARQRIEVCQADAVTFDFPEAPLVIYFFHSFDAQVFSVVLRRLSESMTRRPRKVFFAYLRPEHHALLCAAGFAPLADSGPRAPGSPEWPWRVYLADSGAATAAQGAPTRQEISA
jgi:SAM-dependent methyltransferase